MVTEKKSWFAKYWKDLLKVITAVFLVGYAAVWAFVWADRNYKNNFWSDFFEYSGYAVGVLLLIGWVILWASQKKKQ